MHFDAFEHMLSTMAPQWLQLSGREHLASTGTWAGFPVPNIQVCFKVSNITSQTITPTGRKLCLSTVNQKQKLKEKTFTTHSSSKACIALM